MADLTDEDIAFIKDLREQYESGQITRRKALGLLSGVGIGAAGGVLGTQTVAADASTSDSDGNVGLPNDRVDIYADGVDTLSLSAKDSITDPTGTTYTDLSALQKVTYRQASEPSSPAEGETWYDTDSGIFRVYVDLGSGADWHSIPPVQVLEEASTFTESGVTVTHNKTVVSNGSIELLSGGIIDDFEDGNITTKSSTWDGWNGDTGNLTAQTTTVISGTYSGELEANNEQASITTDRGSNTTLSVELIIRIGAETGSADSVSIQPQESGGGADLGILKFNDGGNITWFNGSTSKEVQASWSADTNYTIKFDWDIPNDQVEIFLDGTSKGTFGLENDSANGVGRLLIKNSTGGSGSLRNIFIDDIQTVGSTTSGNALVEWNTGIPPDIKAWDLATFQRTLDGETVTIDVEDGNGNVLFSDIGQNFDISTVATSKNVTLRANLSRQDTANNPTVDYLARRFTR